MKLLTKNLTKKLPALYAQDGKGEEAIAYAKLSMPDAGWTWYVTEYDSETGECFGLMQSTETSQLKYFFLDEMEEKFKTGEHPLGKDFSPVGEVKIDKNFTPTALKNLHKSTAKCSYDPKLH